MKKNAKSVKINLGCGTKYLTGYINTDTVTSIKADKYFDLESFPYPFSSNSADVILLDNVLEHLTDIVRTMREIHRILKPGGVVEIYVPYGKSDGAFHDPTHKHFFTEKSLDYFTKDSDYNYYSDFEFTMVEKKRYSQNKTTLSNLRNFIPLKSVLSIFLFNMYDSLYFMLKAQK